MSKVLIALGLLFYAASAHAQGGGFTAVQGGAHETGGASSSVTLTNHTTGDIIAVFCHFNDSSVSAPSISVTSGAMYSYSVAHAAYQRSDKTVWQEAFYFLVTSNFTGSDATACVDPTGTFAIINIEEYSGSATSSPIDGSGGQGSSSGSAISTNVYLPNAQATCTNGGTGEWIIEGIGIKPLSGSLDLLIASCEYGR